MVFFEFGLGIVYLIVAVFAFCWFFLLDFFLIASMYGLRFFVHAAAQNELCGSNSFLFRNPDLIEVRVLPA